MIKKRQRLPTIMAERPIYCMVSFQPTLFNNITLRGQSPAPGKILDVSIERAKPFLFSGNRSFARLNLAGSKAD